MFLAWAMPRVSPFAHAICGCPAAEGGPPDIGAPDCSPSLLHPTGGQACSRRGPGQPTVCARHLSVPCAQPMGSSQAAGHCCHSRLQAYKGPCLEGHAARSQASAQQCRCSPNPTRPHALPCTTQASARAQEQFLGLISGVMQRPAQGTPKVSRRACCCCCCCCSCCCSSAAVQWRVESCAGGCSTAAVMW